MRYLWPISLILLLLSCVQPGDDRTPGLKTRNVVLVTFDGLRLQELFSGLDPELLDEEQQALRDLYWKETAEARRRELMPFFWGELAPRGVVLGNRELGSEGRVANPHRFSYPGYAELLTGRVLESIDSNDPVRIPEETVLEYVRRRLDLDPEQVACIASWATFDAICAEQTSTIFVNAGVRELPDSLLRGDLAMLNTLQGRILPPWDDVRIDAITFQIALEYLKVRQPRLLYLALDDTDDWAHRGRYDRVIQTIRFYDDFLRQIWDLLQSLPAYRDQTTLILTSDHGRGSGPDWTRHGKDVPGAEFIWLAIVGPDTPGTGELATPHTFYQRDIAATLLSFLDLDPSEYHPAIGPRIEGVVTAAEVH